jgi:hypothetical protein
MALPAVQGYYSPVIVLLTRHQTAGAPVGGPVKQNLESGLDTAHKLLAKTVGEHKVMVVVSTGDKSRSRALLPMNPRGK